MGMEEAAAHRLGLVKDVPESCSAYNPYGQTCVNAVLSGAHGDFARMENPAY